MASFDPIADLGVPAVVWLLMLAVGLSLKGEDLRRVLRYPRAVLAGILGQLLLLPLVSGALIWALDPPPTLALGLILLAASPGGALANTYNHLAGANLALSVTLTGISSLLALATMPILVGLGSALFLARPESAPMPLGTMVAQLALMLVLPIGLGMTLRSRKPHLAERADRPLRRASLVAIAALLAAVLYSRRADLGGDVLAVVGATLAFAVLSMAAGWGVGRLVGLDAADRFTLLVELGARNLGLVALVGATVLGRLELVLLAAICFLTELPILLALVWAFRRRLGRR